METITNPLITTRAIERVFKLSCMFIFFPVSGEREWSCDSRYENDSDLTLPKGHEGPVHLKDEMAFQDKIFRPGGKNQT